MAVSRAFIALDLPDPILEKLQDVCDNLQNQFNGLPVRWVPINNVHLTIKFIGDLSESNVDMISSILTAECSRCEPFEISIGSLGVFPNIRRPRVLWVGVEAPLGLISLNNKLESEIMQLGYDAETRPYSPHLTIARTSRNASPKEIRSLSQALQKEKLGFVGSAGISEINLYSSKLRKGGAEYTKLFTATLGNK